MSKNSEFSFNISLSVLNHLGRNLYRNFATVLGEAISNSWDADAQNVYITIDKEKNYFSIQDDGIGMNAYDFQNKFLKVGYSKRKDGCCKSKLERPFIGRKGIGKLALLSCADRIHVVSKTSQTEAIGGIIDNAQLDAAISEDNEQYSLAKISAIEMNTVSFIKEQGTYIYFENMKHGIAHSIEYLRKIIALYFRFSILDNNFNIYVNGKIISNDDLKDLIGKTQFVWDINYTKGDSYLEKVKEIAKSKDKGQVSELSFKIDTDDIIDGFIISVEKPTDLKIKETDDTVTVDLFVNGRLREKDILKHIRTRRVPESYLYGQINYNALDDEEDRFTSSRESIKAEDPKFQEFLKKFKSLLNIIMNQWDEYRVNKREDGDPDNTSKMTKKERRARELYNETSKEYKDKSSSIKDEVSSWLDDLEKEAQFNFPSYSECFISENLVRKFIDYKKIPLTKEAIDTVQHYRDKENRSKERAGLNISIRKKDDDKNYLDMDSLANMVDKGNNELYRLPHKAKVYKPTRDAIMHTALVSDEAKRVLTTVLDDIKARIRNLLK